MIDIEKYNWSAHDENKKAAAEIRKDCSTARGILRTLTAGILYPRRKRNVL